MAQDSAMDRMAESSTQKDTLNQRLISFEKDSIYLMGKIIILGTVLSITYITRGINALLVLSIVLIILWFLIEKVAEKRVKLNFWKNVEKKGQFHRLPLKKDIEILEKARKGRRTKRAKIEDRLKDQVYKTLRTEYNLTDEEIKALENGENEKDIPNTELLNFLRTAKGMTALKRKESDNQLFEDSETEEYDSSNLKGLSKKGEDVGFDSRIRRVMDELERILYIEEREDR